jgi:phosphatidylglycerophosphate synthase
MPSKMLETQSPIAAKAHSENCSVARENPISFNHATRMQNSVTSGLERSLLLWLAKRLPSRINSDHLTILGFAAMFLAGASYAVSRRHPVGLLLATLWLAVNWFGDSLDGTLARVRNCQRPRYGFYVDHMIDSIGAVFLMSGLGFSGYIDWRIAMSMLVAFLLLSIESYLASYTLGLFRLSFAKLGPTEIRILLAVGNAALFLYPHALVPGLRLRLFDFAGLVATTGMVIMLIVVAIRDTAILYRQETRP